MKKKILKFGLLAVAVCILSACGAESEGDYPRRLYDPRPIIGGEEAIETEAVSTPSIQPTPAPTPAIKCYTKQEAQEKEGFFLKDRTAEKYYKIEDLGSKDLECENVLGSASVEKQVGTIDYVKGTMPVIDRNKYELVRFTDSSSSNDLFSVNQFEWKGYMSSAYSVIKDGSRIYLLKGDSPICEKIDSINGDTDFLNLVTYIGNLRYYSSNKLHLFTGNPGDQFTVGYYNGSKYEETTVTVDVPYYEVVVDTYQSLEGELTKLGYLIYPEFGGLEPGIYDLGGKKGFFELK